MQLDAHKPPGPCFLNFIEQATLTSEFGQRISIVMNNGVTQMLTLTNEQAKIVEIALRVAADSFILCSIKNEIEAENEKFCQHFADDRIILAMKQRARVCELEAIRAELISVYGEL